MEIIQKPVDELIQYENNPRLNDMSPSRQNRQEKG